MNERIKELAKQSGLVQYDSDGKMVDVEKFAELIVRECASEAKHHVMNISTYADAEFVDTQIKQHFGVEE